MKSKTLRAVIYARYSSENQRDASIEDQVRLCRERIEEEGWIYLHAYVDRALSGANHLRPAYQQLLEDARRGVFDIVVAEALDRMSRDQEHVAALYKQLHYGGVTLVTLAEGEINELHVGLKGTMNALFLKDLAAKTHRGLRGRVEQGRSGGGLCYGYDVVIEHDPRGAPIYGARRANAGEADIVRRIFRAYGAGQSPRSIAKALNAETIPGPRGRPWGASTIHGNRQRGTGILNNELYVGRLVWNRQRFVKDPATGKRQAKPNPESKWLVHDVPELRVVDQELWDAVKARQGDLTLSERSQKVRNALNERHRARYLLSGLLACGVCGGGYTLLNADRYACANHVNRGTCANRRTITKAAIETRVLAGLKEKLLAPEYLAEALKGFQEQYNRRARERESARANEERELDNVERRLKQILDAIEQGIFTATTRDRLLELEARRDRLQAKLKAEPTPAPIPRLHPSFSELYRQKVAALEDALNRPADRTEAHAALRSLIERIVLHPGEKRGQMRAELYGELAAILELANADRTKTRTSCEVRVSLVAGRGFEPLTFRL